MQEWGKYPNTFLQIDRKDKIDGRCKVDKNYNRYF